MLNSLRCSGISAVLSLFSTWVEIITKEGILIKEIIDWLLRNEEAAGQIYEAAAVFFREDKRFCEFLETLAEDEALHVRIMETARNFFQEKTAPSEEAIRLDLDTRSKIDHQIEHIRKSSNREI